MGRELCSQAARAPLPRHPRCPGQLFADVSPKRTGQRSPVWLPWPRTVGGEQEIGCVLLREPSDLVDLLLDLQALQVIELRLVALEGAVDIVLSPAMGLVFALQEGNRRRTSAVGSGVLCCLSRDGEHLGTGTLQG